MMLEDIIFGLALGGMLTSSVLYVIFGQITVRKLRKDPATKDALGVEFASGWDILNVAQALAIPRSWSKKLESSPLSFLHANAECIHKATTSFDRGLAFVMFWLLCLSFFLMMILIVLDAFGLF